MGFSATPLTVVRLRVNKAHSYGGEIASANPLRGPRNQYPGITIITNRLGLRSVLNHLEGRISDVITRRS